MELYLRGGYLDPADLIALAPIAERAGFAGITLPDHVFYPVHPSVPYPASVDGRPPFSLDTGWPDVWVLIGALAAVTTRLRFRTHVYVLPLRHPLLVARAAGTAAVISGNRVELGVGVGHQRDEFDALGVPFAERGRRTDEAIAMLRAVLRPGPVEHHGRWFRLDPAYLHPAPTEPVPIHVGGRSPAAHRRAAMLSDGFITFPTPMEELARLAVTLRELRIELAPERPPLALHATCSDARTAADYSWLSEHGVTSAAVVPWTNAYQPPAPAELRDSVERFGDEVIAPLRAMTRSPA